MNINRFVSDIVLGFIIGILASALTFLVFSIVLDFFVVVPLYFYMTHILVLSFFAKTICRSVISLITTLLSFPRLLVSVFAYFSIPRAQAFSIEYGPSWEYSTLIVYLGFAIVFQLLCFVIVTIFSWLKRAFTRVDGVLENADSAIRQVRSSALTVDQCVSRVALDSGNVTGRVTNYIDFSTKALYCAAVVLFVNRMYRIYYPERKCLYLSNESAVKVLSSWRKSIDASVFAVALGSYVYSGGKSLQDIWLSFSHLASFVTSGVAAISLVSDVTGVTDPMDHEKVQGVLTECNVLKERIKPCVYSTKNIVNVNASTCQWCCSNHGIILTFDYDVEEKHREVDIVELKSLCSSLEVKFDSLLSKHLPDVDNEIVANRSLKNSILNYWYQLKLLCANHPQYIVATSILVVGSIAYVTRRSRSVDKVGDAVDESGKGSTKSKIKKINAFRQRKQDWISYDLEVEKIAGYVDPDDLAEQRENNRNRKKELDDEEYRLFGPDGDIGDQARGVFSEDDLRAGYRAPQKTAYLFDRNHYINRSNVRIEKLAPGLFRKVNLEDESTRKTESKSFNYDVWKAKKIKAGVWVDAPKNAFCKIKNCDKKCGNSHKVIKQKVAINEGPANGPFWPTANYKSHILRVFLDGEELVNAFLARNRLWTVNHIFVDHPNAKFMVIKSCDTDKEKEIIYDLSKTPPKLMGLDCVSFPLIGILAAKQAGFSCYKNPISPTGVDVGSIGYTQSSPLSSGRVMIPKVGKLTKLDKDTGTYTCTTEAGFCGAPVFDVFGHVIGMHKQGGPGNGENYFVNLIPIFAKLANGPLNL